MKYIFVLIFISVFVFFDKNIGYTKTSQVWTHFTYMFQHSGTIHLIINSMSFVGMFRVLEKRIKKWNLALWILSIGFLASFFSAYDIPTVGCSSCVYAMIGIYFALITSKKLVVNDIISFWIFSVSVSICLIVSFFKNNSNYGLHFLSFEYGFLTIIIYEILRRIFKVPNTHEPCEQDAYSANSL